MDLISFILDIESWILKIAFNQTLRDSMRTVCCHQPNFFPYLGVIDKLRQSDVFVVLDTDQFEIGTWGTRNRIKIMMNSQAKWLTVPLKKGRAFRQIREIEVAEGKDWKGKHLNMLTENYRKAQYFDEFFPEIKERVYGVESRKLIDYNLAINSLILDLFKIPVRTVMASELELSPELSATGKLVEITRQLGGDVYLSGASGADYLSKEGFGGLELRIQHFEHPVYPQLGEGFIKNLAVVDYLFNVGATPWW